MIDKIKTFVLDTNVILHDSSCIYQFDEHDVVLPMTVLEELDRFKKGGREVNYHSREFTRALDSMSGNKLFNGGVKIGEGLGKVSIKLESPLHEDLRDNFQFSDKTDNRILNVAYHLAAEEKSREVILVTKDVNLRMKAKAVGLVAADYTTDHVKDISELYRGYRYVEDIPGELLDTLYQQHEPLEGEMLSLERSPQPNEFMVLRNGQKSALVTFDKEHDQVRKVEKRSVYGITSRNVQQTFAIHALLNNDIPLVTITGKAGTGKTLLALAAAIESRRYYRQILLARPIVPLSNKDIGYLPGDIQSKVSPYMQPLYDNLAVIRTQFPENSPNHQRIFKMMEEDKLIIEPLAYIRGRSLVRMYMIVDEAQNLTPHEVKTIITRAGEGTKIIFTGDIYQIDHPYLNTYSNGLSNLIAKLHGSSLYAHINLEKGERSQLADLASDLL